ncbi:polymorphic toxin-type HINT domain-containing protein [Actinosynnema sp. CS-041913]|uniref:golvesin C-terminal-like domain-containing protein n=1 Tax=Actinosynnema sp. CS-041913 TaxID=3239917 RepID=UPI003D921205
MRILTRIFAVGAVSALVASGAAQTVSAAPAQADRRPAQAQAVRCDTPTAPAVPRVSRVAAAPSRPLAETTEAADTTYSAPDTPLRMIPGDEHRVRVTLRNTTATAWPKAAYALSYHWFLPDGSDQTNAGNRLETELPADLAPGATVTVDARLKTPPNADAGNRREAWVLKWDLLDRTTRRWLSQAGVPTLDQAVTVEHPTSDQLGLEKFHQYSGKPTGAGTGVSVNQYAGNAVLSYNAFSNPGRGLATFGRLTYNSQDTSNSYAGRGWSVATSTLQRLGTPLQFDGLLTPVLTGHPNRITLVDGDGTSHEFELDKHDSADSRKWTYASPAGVHLLLERSSGDDDSRRWVFTSPDRTRMFFDHRGYQTATADRNGNELEFHYQNGFVGARGVRLLTHVTDAAGRRTLSLDYYHHGDDYSFFRDGRKVAATGLSDASIVNQLRSVTDISGRRITFTYGEGGLLQEVVDGAGTPDEKPFTFFYDNAHNPKLTRVVDPNGGASRLRYTKDAKLQDLVDRLDGVTSFGYADPDGDRGSKVQSTVTDANGHTATYLIDGFGRTEKLTNANGETTELAWDADNNVVRLREDNGATTTWVYDRKTGSPLEVRDAEANANDWPATRLEYRTDLDGHVADLTGKTSPEGRKWTFVYDDKGNLAAVTDPKGTATAADGDYTTRYTYDDFGHLITTTDANGNTTTYGDYDANGYPQRIVDPLECASFFRYDDVGNVVSTVDAKQKVRWFTFDIFKRPLDSRVPKDAAADQHIVTPGATYDRNDNIVALTAANRAVTTTAYDAMDRQVAVTSPSDDWPGSPTKTRTFAYDKVGNLIRETTPKGTLTPEPDDYTAKVRYDAVNQPVEGTDAKGQRFTVAYDRVGNAVTEADAKKTATPDPADFTTKYVFDLNHRVVKTIDAAGHDVEKRFDRDGNVVETKDEDDVATTIVLDERAKPVEVRAPHDNGVVRTTRYEYDQVGNKTRTTTPRGVDTADDPDDFVHEVVYDELNRVKEQLQPFDRDDADVEAPDRILNSYDEIGNLTEVSAPPSNGQTVRNTTRYAYFDNGWTRSTTDAWGIGTQYEYNDLGQQIRRTHLSAGGGSSRTQEWSYHPDGKRKSRSDGGVPVGKHVALVDNSDPNDTEVVGNWATASGDVDHEGFDYRTHPAGGGGDSFTWKADIPAGGRYEVWARYGTATATDATYTVEHDGGVATVAVDQSKDTGKWVSLGTYQFTEDTVRKVTLTDRANGSVSADAVRLVRDNSGDVDAESKEFQYFYDADDNQTLIKDLSSGARVDEYSVAYDVLDRADKVEERKGGEVRNTTTFTYDANGNVAEWRHDDQSAVFEYDVRDLVAKVTNRKSGDDPADKVTTFSYTPRAHLAKQVKHNGNTVDFEYFLDGMLKHQVEKKKSGDTVVNEHRIEYDANGNRARDESRKQNADDHGAAKNSTFAYTYDPRDRVRKVEKTGDDPATEEYRHDGNNNVVRQKIKDVETTYAHDRNRLVSATAGETKSTYAYDPFGRLSKVSSAGEQTEKYIYDGFDHTAEHRAGTGDLARTTKYVYDPLDRTVSQSTTAAGRTKTTDMLYLGLSEQVLTERLDGEVRKTYQYSPHGELLSQVSVEEDGTEEDLFQSFSPHSDVESVTDSEGDAKATYGYTAYGQDDESAFTGDDKPGAGDPDGEPLNSYRFNTKRYDSASGNYDMGFRDYSPSQNRFLSLDLYNGALNDLGLATNPFTMNRYSFGGGNPISAVEIDGHLFGLSFSDIGHAVLDVAGMIPVVGEVADLANAAWYAAEGNYVDAALSAASAIPFAGYAATAVKAGKYADKAMDAVQATDNVADAARTASKVDPPPAPKADAPRPKAEADAPKPQEPAAPACKVGNSFTGDTPVLMADGSRKAIRDVRVGEKVLAGDPVSGQSDAGRVTGLVVGEGVRELVGVTVAGGGEVVATDGHPFWVENEGDWVPAGALEVGDWLRGPDGEAERVTSIRTWTSFLRVHNLSVAGLHTYYADAILVHNCGTGGEAPRTPDGKYAKRNGEPGRDGAGHEREVWDLLEAEGYDVIRGDVRVQGDWDGGVRIYDGAIRVGEDELIGIEAKTDGRKRTDQRAKDDWINTAGNTGTATGRHRGAKVVGTIIVQVFR